jgi:hypothetical protein
MSREACQKCGSIDIHTRYHKQGCSDPDCSCSNCSYTYIHKQHAEHLHRFCRGCGYDWIDPPADARAAA